MGTLVNRDTASKLTIRSSGCTCRDSNIWIKWEESFTWCAEFPVNWLCSPVKCLESRYVAAPMLLTMGLRGTPSLCIFESTYSLRDLKPAGRSCLHMSSVREDFLSSSVVFRSILSVGSLVSFLYDGSSRREVIFCLQSIVLRNAVALPLSAGRMVRLVFFFRVFNAALSVPVNLSLGLVELFIILTVSYLASSAISTDMDCTVFSTPAKMSSIGTERGVTVQLRLLCSIEETLSSSFWPLKLTTVSFDVFVVGCCVLWSRANFRSCPELAVFPHTCGVLKRELVYRDQSDLESTMAKRRCISSRSLDVLSSSRLFDVSFHGVEQNWCVDRFYWQLGSGCDDGILRNGGMVL